MTTTQTMRAAVVHEFRQPLTIDRLPIPTPGTGQVLMKMEASGVCHTDLYRGSLRYRPVSRKR